MACLIIRHSVIGEWDSDELYTIKTMLSKINSRVGFEVVINLSGIEIELKNCGYQHEGIRFGRV